jgi:hypothetical protein
MVRSWVFMIATRSHSRSASSSRCVVRKTVTPRGSGFCRRFLHGDVGDVGDVGQVDGQLASGQRAMRWRRNDAGRQVAGHLVARPGIWALSRERNDRSRDRVQVSPRPGVRCRTIIHTPSASAPFTRICRLLRSYSASVRVLCLLNAGVFPCGATRRGGLLTGGRRWRCCLPAVPDVPSAGELYALPHAELAQRLAEAYRVIAELSAHVERLEQRAAKDSPGSSKPPSSDSPYKRTFRGWMSFSSSGLG